MTPAQWPLARRIQAILTAETGASFEELVERTGASFPEVKAAVWRRTGRGGWTRHGYVVAVPAAAERGQVA